MLKDWILSKLEAVKDNQRILIRDPLHLLLPEGYSSLHSFARQHGFTVIEAATNLAFRWLYEQTIADPDTKKIMVIDRAPMRRRTQGSAAKAPPLFYPDLLADTPIEARFDLDLQQYLKSVTGDPHWPSLANDPWYAQLIVKNLDSLLCGHKIFRKEHPKRFTDYDFKRMVAFAALGIDGDSFMHPGAEDLWRIGLLGHGPMRELELLVPEITKPIREELNQAPPPFCWFTSHEPDLVIRAFYLSLILSQHTPQWRLLLAHIDTSLAPLTAISEKILSESAPKLIALNPQQADRDLQTVEESLTSESLNFLLFEQLKIDTPDGFAAVIEKECYSTLIRSLSLLMALENIVVSNMLQSRPDQGEQDRIFEDLFPSGSGSEIRFINSRLSKTWSHLVEAYTLAYKIQRLWHELAYQVKTLKVMKVQKLTARMFYTLWNNKKINRLEYYLSALERLIYSSDLLPRPGHDLPVVFGLALERIRKGLKSITYNINQHLDEVNSRFQELIVANYLAWINHDGEIYFTHQFLRRCLKVHWDPAREKAVVFIFDGMRYDIWDELLRPLLENTMEILTDLPALSLLPSETTLSRKAICAGALPDQGNFSRGEDHLLKEGLNRELHYTGQVETVAPEGSGVGEVVRYSAGNLEVYIFELCDRELHKIPVKTLPDGGEVSSRPLAFIYQQHIKNIIDHEVIAIIRNLSPGTKVFITADHGFRRVHRNPIPLEITWLNEGKDCMYMNASLRQNLSDLSGAEKIKDKVVELAINDLHLPSEETAFDRKLRRNWQKQYAAFIFPKIGYAFSRPGPDSRFNPDAYTHGGISMDEMIIPMVALRIKPHEEGILLLGEITGPEEALEGKEAEFSMIMERGAAKRSKGNEIRVDVEASYSLQAASNPLPHQVLYVPLQGAKVVYRFKLQADEAQDDERKQGIMERTLTIVIRYVEGNKVIRKSKTRKFAVRLNAERVIRRVPPQLGNILGLTPKSMR